MVHIKKLEIYGFKSFGFKKTVVHFEKGLVAITGPNGSGKSNILDAIMFAIGENSPKLLRVDKLQSLFHDGQNSKQYLIRISLTFDNTDRGIPVDTDTVTLTRGIEGQNGESQYLLNEKKVTKTTIMELLEVILAAPNKLNIVQQGMITRISELNSEERRKIIEDIVGLSYFDEKKSEALRQLDEADRRLEVAFARIGEIRKRIEELETERNDQLRHDQLATELKKCKAVQISNEIRKIRYKLATSTQLHDSNDQRSTQLMKQIDNLRLHIEKLDAEKTKFIQEVDIANKAKSQVTSKISGLVHDSERTKAILTEFERRINEIETKQPTLLLSKQAAVERTKIMISEIDRVRKILEQKKATIKDFKMKLDSVNLEIEKMSIQIARFGKIKGTTERRLARMASLKGQIELAQARVEERINTIKYKMRTNNSALSTLESEISDTTGQIVEFEKSLESEREKLQTYIMRSAGLAEMKTSLENELAGSSTILVRAESLANKFEERTTLAKRAMNEDLAIAELMKHKDKFGIEGLVHDKIRWDNNYERPILAAGAEWMKAFVVNDINSMMLLVAYAKERKLPRLKIIPLDMVTRFKVAIDIPRDDVNIIGTLSDFVRSDYEKLAAFLFSDTLLVRNSTSAFALSRQGYRTVSAEGELFEPTGGSMSVDFGGRITDMTKAILFGESVGKLRSMISRLSGLIEKKTIQLRNISHQINTCDSERVRLELLIGDLERKINEKKVVIKGKEKSKSQLIIENQALHTEEDSIMKELEKYSRRLSILIPSMEKISSKLRSMDDRSSNNSELDEKNIEHNKIIKGIENANLELGQTTSILNGLEVKLELDNQKQVDLDHENERLTLELDGRKREIEQLRMKSQILENELKILRDQEQQTITSSGNAYGVLQEYEVKIKGLTETERRLSKSHNVIERESALLRKDIALMAAEDSIKTKEMLQLGCKNILDEMEVEMAIKELTDEYNAVRSRINLRADESYVQVIDGYRGMSKRRNQLESERNSIVSFIEQIVKEKEKVFMEAFQRVDNDIRTTFEKMTGGLAWLELENPVDIFSSGVMLLVQFPGKTVPRESTTLSGGEKTIAAIVFLLSLQSLKPSPFYLMDEVDAHLDAENTERLSKVLMDRSLDNQIIMVTLKDSTVASAALIYGIYPKEGVSQVVRYRSSTHLQLAAE